MLKYFSSITIFRFLRKVNTNIDQSNSLRNPISSIFKTINSNILSTINSINPVNSNNDNNNSNNNLNNNDNKNRSNKNELSEEERKARREKLNSAAQDRINAWDKKLTIKRQQNNEIKNNDRLNNGIDGSGRIIDDSGNDYNNSVVTSMETKLVIERIKKEEERTVQVMMMMIVMIVIMLVTMMMMMMMMNDADIYI